MSKMTPARAGPARSGTCDADEFQLPLPGLFADLELGRGSVLLSDDFEQSTSLVKLQVLRDWQLSLARYREQALRQLAAEMAGQSASLDAGERAALVHAACEALHIEIPTDFDVLSAST